MTKVEKLGPELLQALITLTRDMESPRTQKATKAWAAALTLITKAKQEP